MIPEGITQWISDDALRHHLVISTWQWWNIFTFTTTFLHTHSWPNWVDEDEVGLKEKPEDTKYIQRLHRNKTRSTGSMGKDLIRTLVAIRMWPQNVAIRTIIKILC